MKQILYTVAKNELGKLIQAKDASKGPVFYCITCGGSLILKKSEAGKRRPHFAHNNLTANCTPEGALHEGFKMLLADKINSNIKNNIDIKLNWECSFCHENHTLVLLKNIEIAKVEHNLAACRPDIALLSKGSAITALEVVVTHYPEENTEKYYRDNNIKLVRFDLTGDEDLAKLDNNDLTANYVSECPNPVCDKCGDHMRTKFTEIIKTACYKDNCGADMLMAVYRIGGFAEGPDKFTPEQLQYARSKGAIIKDSYSNTIHGNYLANICGKCNAFIGNWHLGERAMEGAVLESQNHGFVCERCIWEGK